VTAAIENIGGGQPGQCQIFWFHGEQGFGCTVKYADPSVLIDHRLLSDLFHTPEQCNPALGLIWPSPPRAQKLAGMVDFADTLLRIEAPLNAGKSRLPRNR
jgi:hypothetical protein